MHLNVTYIVIAHLVLILKAPTHKLYKFLFHDAFPKTMSKLLFIENCFPSIINFENQ